MAGFCAVNSREVEWHFFTRTEKKYTNGNKINRATDKGFWKATGRDRAVRHNSEIVGMKKTLVYHEGRAPAGRRTDWVMHEYRLTTEELGRAALQQKDAYFLCKIYLKSRGAAFNGEDWENDAVDSLVPFEDAAAYAEDEEDSELNLTNVFNFQGGASSSQAVQLPEKPQGFRSLLRIREREEDDDDYDEDEAVYLDKGKKPKLMMLDLFPGVKGGSDSSSSATISDPQPTKKVAAAGAAAETEFSSGLLNFSLAAIQPNKVQENHGSSAFNSSSLEDSLPPGYLKFITELEEERDTLKHALMNSEATVSCLQADNDRLAEEISRLRSLLPGGQGLAAACNIQSDISSS
ncbi:PREDICTED: NAC domain-containing protein 17-like [Ipomoea nil]|uniref:NAC domain-containing protein 17-like n=1 Tax=Ipomoea nil TaxID=35883 RepID=UPI00090108A6|nr:PREDICTED: NAC domain-containing protein 17-like [Ipomoea nil]